MQDLGVNADAPAPLADPEVEHNSQGLITLTTTILNSIRIVWIVQVNKTFRCAMAKYGNAL